MSIFRKSKPELIHKIEWDDYNRDTLVWPFQSHPRKIRNGAQLIVSEKQTAVLVNEKQFADIYQSGHYQLTTLNMPILSTQKGWKSSYDSPFKVDIYFVNTNHLLNSHWGTPKPIEMNDTEFGPVRIRVFGTYSFRIHHNPVAFIRNVAGIDGDFSPKNISEQLHNFVLAKFMNYLTDSKIAVLDLASNLKEFSSELLLALKNDFTDYGIELTNFLVETISLPKIVEVTLDKQTHTGSIDNLRTYAQLQFIHSFKNKTNKIADDGNLLDDTLHSGNGLKPTDKKDQETKQEQHDQSVSIHSATNSDLQKVIPPPLPQQATYHLAINGVQQGPFLFTQLIKLVEQGKLTADTLVWTAGMNGWKAAKSVPLLAHLFSNVPPQV